MFGFFEQLLHGRSDPKQQAVRSFQSASLSRRKRRRVKLGIAYDQKLISTLKIENETLIEEFGRVFADDFRAHDFTHLSQQLSEFKVIFQNHLITENVKLFCYLEQQGMNDPSLLSSVRTFRKEINYWSNAVIGFCKKYEQPLAVFMHQESFKNEYQAIGQALIHRVQLVESEMYLRYRKN